jgi:hypothetical protein
MSISAHCSHSGGGERERADDVDNGVHNHQICNGPYTFRFGGGVIA